MYWGDISFQVAQKKLAVLFCHLGTHGITYQERTSNVPEEDSGDKIDQTTQATVECDVPFEKLLKGDYHLIYSHPEALIKSRFSNGNIHVHVI